MLEIEQKFANVDLAALEAKLKEWGVGEWEERFEADHYLNAPDRDFAQTKEAFRLRRVGEQNYLTYKGPRLDPNVKIRPELELPVAPGEQSALDLLRLFQHLGYRPVAVVRKRRRQAKLESQGFVLTACLDEVAELGEFAELEIVAPEDRMDEARRVLVETVDALGLTQVEHRSYLTMLLTARQGG